MTALETVCKMREIKSAADELVQALHELDRFQNFAGRMNQRCRSSLIRQSWSKSISSARRIGELVQYGRRFELPITVYEVDARGSKFKRDDVTVVARILEELWRKMASISSGKPLDAVPGVMSSLEAISQELRHNSMRLGAAIRAEESAQRYTAS